VQQMQLKTVGLFKSF